MNSSESRRGTRRPSRSAVRTSSRRLMCAAVLLAEPSSGRSLPVARSSARVLLPLRRPSASSGARKISSSKPKIGAQNKRAMASKSTEALLRFGRSPAAMRLSQRVSGLGSHSESLSMGTTVLSGAWLISLLAERSLRPAPPMVLRVGDAIAGGASASGSGDFIVSAGGGGGGRGGHIVRGVGSECRNCNGGE